MIIKIDNLNIPEYKSIIPLNIRFVFTFYKLIKLSISQTEDLFISGTVGQISNM